MSINKAWTSLAIYEPVEIKIYKELKIITFNYY